VPDREAVVCGDRRVTYGELDERATRLAHAWASLGVAAGTHVGLQLYDSVEHVESMLACYKLRAVPINVNWRYVEAELQHLLADADVVALVHEPEFPPLRQPALARGAAYEAAVASGRRQRDFGPRSPDDHYVLYTGGTTGMPKGVVWRQEDIFFAVMGGGNPGGMPIAHPENIVDTVLHRPELRLQAFLGPGDAKPAQFVQLGVGPLMHASGQWSALGALLSGAKVVLYPERHLDMTRVLDLVERERVTGLNMVGDSTGVPLLAALRAGNHDTSSLRLLGSGGAMLSSHVKADLMHEIPSLLAITEGVGSSEAPVEGVAVTTRAGGPAPSLHFAPRPDTMVVDDDFRPVAPGSGVAGRVAVRGRLPIGYYNDPEKTARTFVEVGGQRWVLPGDMATVEADGTVRLLGRGSMCINTGGEKVYPEEVEAALRAHAAVADALVVGQPHERFGEQVVAIVQAAGGAGPSLGELQAHCRRYVAGYKLPRRLIVVDGVRRSQAGKPDYQWAAAIVGASSSRSRLAST
jgi:acyl-CoA synthetase (AMP-forming)/AMP-acid ligase II